MRVIGLAAAFVSFFAVSANAVPNGQFNFTIEMGGQVFPLKVRIANEKMSMRASGYLTTVGETKTRSASATKIVGRTNFKTGICNASSIITFTMRFKKDGSYDRASINGKCTGSGSTFSTTGKVTKN